MVLVTAVSQWSSVSRWSCVVLVTVVSHSGLLSAGGPVWSGNSGLTQWSSVSWWSSVEGSLFVPQWGQVLSVSRTCPHDGVWQALSEER